MKTREQLNTDILLSILSSISMGNVIALHSCKSQISRVDRDAIIKGLDEISHQYKDLKGESVYIQTRGIDV